MDGENDAFPAPEKREKVEQLLPRDVFPIEQPHPLRRLVALQYLRARIHPISQQSTPHVAWRDARSGIVPDALHLARIPDRIDVELPGALFSRRRSEPNRRSYALSASSEGFEIQILAPSERLEWIAGAHVLLMRGIPSTLERE